jgi:S-DNA-T family DNA segregation ATPase FtsK/SpoIIIE
MSTSTQGFPVLDALLGVKQQRPSWLTIAWRWRYELILMPTITVVSVMAWQHTGLLSLAGQVELGPWEHCAERFVANRYDDAIDTLTDLRTCMDDRYDALRAADRLTRKIAREGDQQVILVAIDELAYFSATIGTKAQREAFTNLVRDLVARGRAAGIIMVVATQRPSADVVPTSLRDLFGYRWAFRCSTDASSDTILGHGWANLGYTATDIDPLARGVGWLLAEGGMPRRIKAAYLADEEIEHLAAYAAAAGSPTATPCSP